MYKFFVIALAVITLGCVSCRQVDVTLRANPATDRPEDTQQPQPFGTNLSGAEFGSNVPGQYQHDYSYPTTADLDYFKSKGLKLIRLPFLWERMQPEINGPLDPVELKRLTDFVDAAGQRNMLIIPDVHNFGRRLVDGASQVIGTTELPGAALTDLWVRLATALKDKNNIWAYGIMNEPHNMPSADTWFNVIQEVITQVRAVDSETAILVAGDSYSSATRWPDVSDNLKNLTDPSDNLIYEAHVYFDNTSGGVYDESYDDEKATENTGVERLKPFVDWLAINNKKGFIGEYGIPDDDERWLVVLDNMLQYMKDNCINGTYWSAGPRWGGYRLAIEPINGVDRPQMKVLKNYTQTDPQICR